MSSLASRPASVRRSTVALPRLSELHVVEAKAASEPSWKRACSSLGEQWTSFFYDNIPHDYIKLLGPKPRLFFGTLLYVAIGVLAALIFFSLYVSNANTVFLSPTFGQGCVKVDRPTTGIWLGDTQGRWSGTNAFDPSMALYSFQFNNFTTAAASSHSKRAKGLSLLFQEVDAPLTLYQEYTSMMHMACVLLTEVLKPIMERQNLALNLLYLFFWSALQVTGDADNRQVFSFTGDPSVVFGNLEYNAAGLATARGRCGAQSFTSISEHTWTVRWDASDYTADKNCTDALPLSAVGFVVGQPSISLSIDVRSFLSATAANQQSPLPAGSKFENETLYGYQRFGLSRVAYAQGASAGGAAAAEEGRVVLEVGNPPSLYWVDQYYDQRYPGMDPIFCLASLAGGRLTCFLKVVGDLFVFPLFNHFGETSNLLNPTLGAAPCTCPLSPSSPGAASNCDNFDFLSSMLFFRADLSARASPSTAIFWAMTEFLRQGGKSRSDDAYLAAWHTAPHLLLSAAGYSPIKGVSYDVTGSYMYSDFKSEQERQRAFSFCDTPFGSCSLLTIRSTKNDEMLGSSWAVSRNYFQFVNGGCAFSLFNESAWEGLSTTPPTQFEEDYYRCYPLPWQALATASGLALANTKAAAPFLVLFLVNLLFFFQWFSGSHLPRQFSAEEKETVLGLLAGRVLLLQQQRATPSSSSSSSASSSSSSGSDPVPPPHLPVLSALMRELGLDPERDPKEDEAAVPVREIYTVRADTLDAPARRIAACLTQRPLTTQTAQQPSQRLQLRPLTPTPLAKSVDRDSAASSSTRL